MYKKHFNFMFVQQPTQLQDSIFLDILLAIKFLVMMVQYYGMHVVFNCVCGIYRVTCIFLLNTDTGRLVRIQEFILVGYSIWYN